MIVSQKQNYIDAVRGWAILLVITCHCGNMFPEMPYPVKKLTNFGWHGVQLFFLASAVTLLISWNNARQRGSISVSAFLIRRFLRIAPMYYLGALIYFVAEPPQSGFNVAQLVRIFTFVNSWSPDWIPTTPGWMVVPGGWSIGVEFTFYALLPILATMVTSLSRACVLFVVSIAGACIGNVLGADWLASYPDSTVRNFLYFWFPNQFPIFALGMVLYFCIVKFRHATLGVSTAYGMITLVAAALVVIAECPSGSALFLTANLLPPILLASLGFSVFIFILSKAPDTLVVHPVIRKIGVLSFSAYVLHFLFIHGLVRWTGGLVNEYAKGFAAVANLALLWLLAVPCTLLAAKLANKYVERPGIDLARRLTAKWAPIPVLVGKSLAQA